MTLIKHPLTEPKQNNDGDVLLYIGAALVVVICMVILFGCNPVTKAYKGVAKYSPQTKQDTTNFYKRANDLIKPTTKTVFKPGATVKVPVRVPVKVLDTLELERLSDSLQLAHNSDLNDAIDDCMASVKEARKQGLNEGFKNGQQDALNNFQQKLPDTIIQSDPATELALINREFDLRNAQAELIKVTAERDIYKKQSGNKNWWIIALIVLIGGSTYWRIRRKIPII